MASVMTIDDVDVDVPMSDDIPYDEDVEAELEVDELDPSDDEQTPNTNTDTELSGLLGAAWKKEDGQRTPGQTLFPATKVENILQANGVGTGPGSIPMSKEAVYMLSVATEEMIKLTIKWAWEEAKYAKTTPTIGYDDIANVPIVYRPEMEFLQDIIPRPTSLTSALEKRAKRLKEIEDEDPALGGYIPPPYLQSTSFLASSVSANPSASASASTSSKSKSKKETKASVNGKTNGTSASAKTKKEKEVKAPTSSAKSRSASTASSRASTSVGKRRSARNGNAAAKPPVPSPLVNGHTPNDTALESGMNVDAIPTPSAMDMPMNSLSTTGGSPWTSQPIGPMTGFLPPLSYGVNELPPPQITNPGRTIYSQETGRPD